MTAHSRIGASSMYRWSACPGSVRASEGIAQSASAYAEEGTEAHELAALALNSDGPAAAVLTIAAVMGKDQEMADAVQVYVDAVLDERKPGCTLAVEQKFDLSSVHPGCFGTADAVIWNPATQVLTVMDYKHGAGIPVEVRNNPQLKYYGLGALLASNYPAKTVKLVIVQPRCEHPDGPVRSETIDAFDLIEFRADLKQYAEATEKPDAPLVPGNHCRFCPAARSCKALESRAQLVAKSEFSPVYSYDPEKLAEVLDSIPAVEARIKAIREFAYAEAEAGRPPPRHKLVAKQGRRKWRDENEVITAAELSWPVAECFDHTLKSPAQLEKVTSKAFVSQFTVIESSGHVLVPESDKRPAARLAPVLEFTPVEKENA